MTSLASMADELVKIAKMRHEDQRYAEYKFGHGRGNIAKATKEQKANAKMVMGGLRDFLSTVSSRARDRGMLHLAPKEMHIPIGGGHTALVENMPHGLVAKTVYDSSYNTKDKPVMSLEKVKGLFQG